MNTQERARKLSALSKLMQGDTKLVEALRPPMIIDLDQFSPDELEAIRLYQVAYFSGGDYAKELAHFEQLRAGREIRMIPANSANLCPSSYERLCALAGRTPHDDSYFGDDQP